MLNEQIDELISRLDVIGCGRDLSKSFWLIQAQCRASICSRIAEEIPKSSECNELCLLPIL